MSSAREARRRVKRRTSILCSKILPQGEFTSPEEDGWKGFPQKRSFCGRAKKKMRNLGTVQVPTEAFLAVLKLDEG